MILEIHDGNLNAGGLPLDPTQTDAAKYGKAYYETFKSVKSANWSDKKLTGAVSTAICRACDLYYDASLKQIAGETEKGNKDTAANMWLNLDDALAWGSSQYTKTGDIISSGSKLTTDQDDSEFDPTFSWLLPSASSAQQTTASSSSDDPWMSDDLMDDTLKT